MAKGILKVTKESNTGRNLEFQNTGNNEKLTLNELVKRLETGKSSYNDDYCVKHDKNGNKYIASKPDGNEKNNLG